MNFSIASASLPGHDFADWLSPILVKELRQGLKARVFVSVFTVVQIAMIFIMGMQLLAMSMGTSSSTVREFDGFFWVGVWLPLLVLMPARGLGAVSEEVKANTLDLVQLTRMGAFRIVLGKWLALAAQSVLLVTAILPYAVLRYYFGNVDVVGDLETVAWMLASSLVLTAGALALSSLPLVARIIVLVVLVPGGFIGAEIYANRRFFGGGTSTPADPTWWMHLTAILIYTIFFLEVTASRIAPPAANHAGIKRCGALLLALLPLGLGAINGTDWGAPMAFMLMPLWAWILFEALTEQTSVEPNIYAGFLKRGLPGRVASRVFTPGWASGVIFTALLVALVAIAAKVSFLGDKNLGRTMSEMAGHQLEWLMLFFAIVGPVLCILALPRVKQRGWVYIIAQLLSVLLFSIAMIAGAASQEKLENILPLLGPVPTSALLAMMERGTNAGFVRSITLPFLVSAAVISALLLWRMFVEFNRIAQVEKEARASMLRQPGI